MIPCRAMAYRYFKALLIGPSIAAALYACATDSSSTETNNTAPDTGITHTGGTVSGSATWGAGSHTVEGTIAFSNGVLTIAPGATVVMTAGNADPTSLQFGKGAGLVIQGNATAPVSFTSSAGQPSRGDWGNIEFQPGSLPSQISNANFVYGGATVDPTGGTILIDAGTDVLITNTTVEQSLNYGVLLSGDANISGFYGNTLTHNASGPISLPANSVSGMGQGTYTPNDVEGIDVTVSQLAQNANWKNLGVPYVLEGLTIETLGGQAVLNVAAGVKLLMAKGSVLVVQKNGGLVLNGSQEAPVVVTSAASPSARGDWGDIEFFTNSLGSVNSINYAEIEYGGGSGAAGNYPGEIWLESDSTAAINNSNITNSSSAGVSVAAHGTLSSFSNNTITHNASFPVQIDVDDVRQLQNYNNIYVPNDSTGIAISGSPLHTTTSWRNLGTNYFVQNLFNIDFGVALGYTTLTLDAGTVVTFASGMGLNTTDQGQIIANGNDPSVEGNAGYVEFNGQGAQPGDGTNWSSIHLAGGVNELHWTRVRYGGLGGDGAIFFQAASIVLDNVSTPILAGGQTTPVLNCGGIYNPVFNNQVVNNQMVQIDPNYVGPYYTGFERVGYYQPGLTSTNMIGFGDPNTCMH